MMDQKRRDDAEDSDPTEAALLREIAAIGAEPTEEGVERLVALLEHVSAMVHVRASTTLLDVGYGPAEEGEPVDEDEP